MGVNAGRRFRHDGTPPDSYRVGLHKKPRIVFESVKRKVGQNKAPFSNFQTIQEGPIIRPKSLL